MMHRMNITRKDLRHFDFAWPTSELFIALVPMRTACALDFFSQNELLALIWFWRCCKFVSMCLCVFCTHVWVKVKILVIRAFQKLETYSQTIALWMHMTHLGESVGQGRSSTTRQYLTLRLWGASVQCKIMPCSWIIRINVPSCCRWHAPPKKLAAPEPAENVFGSWKWYRMHPFWQTCAKKNQGWPSLRILYSYNYLHC